MYSLTILRTFNLKSSCRQGRTISEKSTIGSLLVSSQIPIVAGNPWCCLADGTWTSVSASIFIWPSFLQVCLGTYISIFLKNTSYWIQGLCDSILITSTKTCFPNNVLFTRIVGQDLGILWGGTQFTSQHPHRLFSTIQSDKSKIKSYSV